jgi:hypothetical protein
MVLGNLNIHRRLKLVPYLSFYIKINSKWIKDLNLKPETLKLVEGNTEDTGISNNFLNSTPSSELDEMGFH